MVIRRRTLIVVIVLFAGVLIGQREYYRRRTTAPFTSPQPRDAAGPCVDFRQAASRAGENTCITGYVLRAYTSRSGNTFLDFCQDYRSCPFTSVIFASDHAKFGNLETLAGRRVELRGLITTYRNQAEIIVHDPWQIQASP